MYDDATGYGRPVDMWASGVIMYTLYVFTVQRVIRTSTLIVDY